MRRSYAVLTIAAFAFLSVASGKPKGESAPEKSTTTTTSAGDPTKSAKLIGSCDNSGNFHLSCFEEFSPEKPEEEKKKCESSGGKWREAVGCPRLKAVTQCFQGNEPHLSGSYNYEGTKHPSAADECPRGFRDYRKTPELTAAPASCDAIATNATCSQYTKLNAEFEKSCLESGGKVMQPPTPCPAKDVAMTLKFAKDGDSETELFYKTAYKSPGTTASKTWEKGDLKLFCALAGDGCTMGPLAADSAPSAKAGAAAKTSNGGGGSSKAKAKK